MTTPKLTEAQRACLQYLAEEGPFPGAMWTYGTIAELGAMKLIALNPSNPWGGGMQTITDAGRAALRGEP